MASSLSRIYTKHHHENRGEGFSIYPAVRAEFIKESLTDTQKVLDIGARDGTLTAQYADGREVLCLDIDPEALKLCKKKGFRTRLVDLNGDWSLKEKFDGVVAGEVLEHLYFPEEIAQQVSSVLKKNGVFVGSVPNAFNIKNRLRYLRGSVKYTPLADPTHINQFSVERLRRALEPHFSEVIITGFAEPAWIARMNPNLFSHILLFRCTK